MFSPHVSAPDFLGSMYRLFSWRIASHVPHWDWEQIRGEVHTWEEWLPGCLRNPLGTERPPLVVLLPGADSTKEELYDQAEHLVRRGLAAFPFDGPGHGLVSFRLKLRADEEVAVSAVLDHLVSRDDLDAERVGVLGI